jgi:2-phosphosulfolactate phosphatase
MDIRITDFVRGAQSATGLAIVIDVFRAFSLAAHAFAAGVTRILPVADAEDAFRLKAQFPHALLIGERYARPLPGVDCGNSPTQLLEFDLRERTLIHTTHSGTQGLVNATQADEVVTGALVNAAAIVRYVQSRQPAVVTIVRMGQEARARCIEDDVCAELLRARLQGSAADQRALIAALRTAPSAAKFFDPECDWAPARDFDLCTQLDVFDFVLRLDRNGPMPMLQRIDVPSQ